MRVEDLHSSHRASASGEKERKKIFKKKRQKKNLDLHTIESSFSQCTPGLFHVCKSSIFEIRAVGYLVQNQKAVIFFHESCKFRRGVNEARISYMRRSRASEIQALREPVICTTRNRCALCRCMISEGPGDVQAFENVIKHVNISANSKCLHYSCLRLFLDCN